MSLFTSIEKIYLEARDRWSTDKDPRYLKIQEGK
jgi:hypothetical protein